MQGKFAPTIRDAIADDRLRLKEICRLSFKGIYRFFSTRSIIQNRRVLVAEMEGKAAGFIVLKSTGLGSEQAGYIFWLAVHPDARRTGVATSLISASLGRFKSEGMDIVYASIEEDNPEPQILFKKLGFSPISRKVLRRKYRWDMIRMYSRFLIAPHELVYFKKLK